MEGNIPPGARVAQREGASITGAMPAGQSAAWSTSGQIVAGHPESSGPFMTVGMRIHTFKLAYPGIIISSDNRTATWRDVDNTEHNKSCDTSGELIDFLETTFRGGKCHLES